MLDRMLSADGGAVREALRADGGIQEQDIVFIKVGGESLKKETFTDLVNVRMVIVPSGLSKGIVITLFRKKA